MNFLLELLSEEIPARMQVKAKEDLARLFTAELAKAGLAASSLETFATPRRLAIIAQGLPLETAAVSEETKGPKVGAPPQAMEGFLRKVGLTQDQLVERDGIYFAVVEKPGRKTADVLAEAIPAIIRAFPWPKSQRWGAASISTESLRWVRPLQGIVALLGEDVVPCGIEDMESGRTTMGHRFHSSGPVTIPNAEGYVEALRAAHVIVHFSERCALIRDGAAKAAADAGLVLVEDEGLVVENAGLTEWPVPMLGRFDPAFLDVPQEVIQLTARVNQKYFVCHDSNGKLANAFICTANIVAHDGGAAIVAGNEKVLAARLSDAKFFWEQDLKIPLEEQAKKLSNIVFHEKLGTVADKVERVAKLARWLVESGVITNTAHPEPVEGLPSTAHKAGLRQAQPERVLGGAELAEMAERAARLCKADLVTGMVGEFPELQGVMGGYYARAQGEPDEVADAIRDHYKPVGQGDDVPTAPVTVAVSLADKLDTLVGFFAYDMKPTGSKDPFALRRAGLGVIQLITRHELCIGLGEVLFSHAGEMLLGTERSVARQLLGTYKSIQSVVGRDAASKALMAALQNSEISPEAEADKIIDQAGQATVWLLVFFSDRLKVQQREAGVRHDLIDAVFALGGEDDLVRLLARVKALQAFVGTEDGVNLLAAYKRAANILKSNAQTPTTAHPERSRGTSSSEAENSEAADTGLGSAWHSPSTALGMSGVEESLKTALNTAELLAAAAVTDERFEDAMSALATLRSPIDAFFEGVMVNDPDPDIRAFRLGLLTRFRNAVHAVADFSKIEG